jgi:hypothetical protein
MKSTLLMTLAALNGINACEIAINLVKCNRLPDYID